MNKKKKHQQEYIYILEYKNNNCLVFEISIKIIHFNRVVPSLQWLIVKNHIIIILFV